MFLLVISLFGLVFRLLRICFRAFSKAMLMRKSHGSYFSGIRISSSEAFVLELVLDNLGKTPTFASKVMRDVAARLKELSLNDDGTLGSIHTPLISSFEDRYTVKKSLGPGDSQRQPSHAKEKFYSENLNQSGDANLINLRDESQKESNTTTDMKLETIDQDYISKDKSCTEESSKLSKKEKKKLKKEARKLTKTLEPLPQVKEEIEDSGEEIVKTEEPSVAPFPNLPRPSDKSVASFLDNSNSKREWL